LPLLFRSVPSGLAGEISSGVLILGLSAAISLPLSAYTGVLVGMQRNELPAMAIASNRLFGAIAVILVARHTHSLAWLALCIGGFNLVASFVQYGIAKKLLPGLRVGMAFLDRAMAAELFRYCSTLSVWSLVMLLVNGLGVTIVGLFNFQAVGAYSIAMTLITFFTGLTGAAFSALLAPVAVLQTRQEYARISRLILVTTRLNSYFSVGVIVVTFLFGDALVRAWVGPAYLAVTLPVLKILLVGQAIRALGNAYATALVGLGLQRYGLVPALIEGGSNLVLSVLGMILIGPTGVAWATLAASGIGITTLIFVIFPRIKEVPISRQMFVGQGLLIPLLPFLPFAFWMLSRGWIEDHFQLFVLGRGLLVALLLTITAWLTWGGVRRTLQSIKSA
jgi:O-antigen/teichoic acid export membrane protein